MAKSADHNEAVALKGEPRGSGVRYGGFRSLGTVHSLNHHKAAFLRSLASFKPAKVSRKGKLTNAVAYLRTSSAANAGADKDSDKRQLAAIERYARSASIEIVGTYNDAAVSGVDHVQARPGFAAMLERIEGNGVRTIIVETPSRFARDLIVQETGYVMLRERGIALIAADSPGSFLDDTATAILIRQVLGAITQFDKAMTVAKLKGARDRKRQGGEKVKGRKSYLEWSPDAIALARKLRRKRPKGGRLSLRDVSTALASAGHLAASGKPYGAAAVARMLGA